jgi:hypothetical protein
VLDAIESFGERLGFEVLDQLSGASDAGVELVSDGFADGLPVAFCVDGGCFECREGLAGSLAAADAGVLDCVPSVCEALAAVIAVARCLAFGREVPPAGPSMQVPVVDFEPSEVAASLAETI